MSHLAKLKNKVCYKISNNPTFETWSAPCSCVINTDYETKHQWFLITPNNQAVIKATVSQLRNMDRVKRIWYLSPMRAAKVQASLRIHAVSPEPSLLAHTSSESRGTFRQKTRSLATLNGWTCAVEICHDGMLEDTNSLDGAHIITWMLQIKFNWLLANKHLWRLSGMLCAIIPINTCKLFAFWV